MEIQYKAFYLDYMNAWRLYDPEHEEQTVAYIDTVEELPKTTELELTKKVYMTIAEQETISALLDLKKI